MATPPTGQPSAMATPPTGQPSAVATPPTDQPSADVSSSSTSEPKWFTYIFEHDKASTKLPVMYSTPKNMRMADDNIYESAPRNIRVPDRFDPTFDPVVAAVGPVKSKRPLPIDDRKNRIVFAMLKRRGNGDPRKLLKELVDATRTVQPDARGFYFKSFPDEHFFQIMVIDGCFVLEIFRMHAGLYAELADDPFYTMRWALPGLAQDIVKVQNQLPYNVLEVLHEKTKLQQEPTLKHLAQLFLDFLSPGLNREMIEDNKQQDHLLSLFHSMCIPNRYHTQVHINNEESRFNSFPSVTDLRLSGIKVVKKQQWKKLLEIEYKNGKLEIPTMVIDHNTKILMRNMIAYEQCNKKVPDVFTSYVTFLGALVNSAEDVEVLRVAGVINHFMSSNEEVSVLLNSLTANIRLDMSKGYLADLNTQIYRDHQRASTWLKTRIKRHLSSREGRGYLIAGIGMYLGLLQIAIAVITYVLPKS